MLNLVYIQYMLICFSFSLFCFVMSSILYCVMYSMCIEQCVMKKTCKTVICFIYCYYCCCYYLSPVVKIYKACRLLCAVFSLLHRTIFISITRSRGLPLDTMNMKATINNIS